MTNRATGIYARNVTRKGIKEIKKEMNGKVKIYTTPNCHFCTLVENWLKANDIKFEEVDVSLDCFKREDLKEKTGYLGVPVLEVSGTYILGYDVKKMEKLFDVSEGTKKRTRKRFYKKLA